MCSRVGLVRCCDAVCWCTQTDEYHRCNQCCRCARSESNRRAEVLIQPTEQQAGRQIGQAQSRVKPTECRACFSGLGKSCDHFFFRGFGQCKEPRVHGKQDPNVPSRSCETETEIHNGVKQPTANNHPAQRPAITRPSAKSTAETVQDRQH